MITLMGEIWINNERMIFLNEDSFAKITDKEDKFSPNSLKVETVRAEAPLLMKTIGLKPNKHGKI